MPLRWRASRPTTSYCGVSEHAAACFRSFCRAAGRADGQQRSRASEYWRGSHRAMDITRIDALIASGEFFTHPAIVAAMQHAREGGRSCICWGCFPTAACIRTRSICMRCCKPARQHGVERVFVHAFMDGRDTLPTAARDIWQRSNRRCASMAWATWPPSPAAITRWIATGAGSASEGLRRDGEGKAEGGVLHDAMARMKESLQQRHHRRVHCSFCGDR